MRSGFQSPLVGQQQATRDLSPVFTDGLEKSLVTNA